MDSISYAAELGRLDFISVLLAIIAIGLGLAAFLAYARFVSVAKREANETATAVARAIAEKQANDYIQRELPNILAAYKDLFGMDDSVANEIASRQDDGESDGSRDTDEGDTR